MPGEPIETGGLLLGLRDLADDMKERSISLVENRRQRSIADVQFKDVVRAVKNRVRGRKFSISAGNYDRRPSTMDYEEIPIDNLAEGSILRSNNGMIV
jgi:hypothetical protein